MRLVEVLAEVVQVLGCGEASMTERDLDLPDLMGVSSLDRKQHLALRPAARLLEEALRLGAEAGEDRVGAVVIEAAVEITSVGANVVCRSEMSAPVARERGCGLGEHDVLDPSRRAIATL